MIHPTRSSAVVLAVVLTLAGHGAADVPRQAVVDAVPRLDALVEQTLTKTGVPGLAVAVVYKDEVLHLKGFGVRKVGEAGRVDADTVFQLASVSKPLTTTVLAALVGDGVVRWDDGVIDHDPAFRLSDPWVTRHLTLRDLLCHRSGLPDHAGDLLEDLGFVRQAVLHRLRHVKPLGAFRQQYAYTNFGFTAAAVAAARAAGKPWEEVAAEKLFRPLGMKASSYRFVDYAGAEARAWGHVRDGDKWAAKYVRRPDAQAPAGGASASVRDLALWLRVLVNGGRLGDKQVIAGPALAETFQPQIVSHRVEKAGERAGFYGLGWNVNYDADQVRLSHSGAFALGAATAVTLLPADGLGVVVLTNAAPIGVPEAVCAGFLDLVRKGKVERDWLAVYRPFFVAMAKPAYGTAADYLKAPAKRTPALAAAAYIGRYHNDFYGDVEVVAKGPGLAMRFGPRRAEYELRHFDRDVYTYQPVGENAGGVSAVVFTVAAEGRATRVVVDNLNVEGQGGFTRVEAAK